jgi:signal transduction histidine kinase
MTNLTIKTKLFLIILIILVPLTIVQLYFVFYHYNSVIESELEKNHDFAESIKMIITNHITGLDKDLYNIGLTIVNSPHMSTEDKNLYLTQQKNNNPAMETCTWMSPDGTILASSFKKAIGVDAQGRDFYNRILDGEDLVISDVMISRVDNEPFIGVFKGIREGTTLLGIMLTRLDIDFFSTIMPEHRISASTSFGITDRNGIIVYREGYPQIIRQMIIVNTGPIRAALDSGMKAKSKKLTSAVTGKSLLGVAIPMHEIGGMVAYANSEYSEVTSKAYNSIRINILALIFTTIFSLLWAVRVSKSIVEPINTLQHFARNISQGDLEARANIPGDDELAATGQALNQMASKIKHLENTRRMFIQASAHELRNPMSGIKGIIALSKRRLVSGKPVENVISLLDTAEEEVDSLSVILNQLLDAFKEQNTYSAGLVYNFKIINIADLVVKVTNSFQLGDEKISIINNVNSEIPVFVNGDAAKLEGVVRNLLSNAVKYSPGEKEITVSLEVTDDSAVISVQDKGIGIPETQLEQVFEAFVRAENLGGNDPGGLGLGLHICKDIIAKHGGTIWAKNNSNKGSTFYIKLPVINLSSGGEGDSNTANPV